MLQKLRPFRFAKLRHRTFQALLARSLPGAKEKVARLKELYPEASPRELAYKLLEEKKTLASLAGGVSGSLGFVGIPMDMVAMTWLQASLLAEIASLFEINIHTARSAQEALELLNKANGLPLWWRMLPKTLGGAAALLSKRLGTFGFGKAIPLLSAPLSAYFNHRHLQAVGEEAIRRYNSFPQARQKLRQLLQPHP